MTTLWHYTAVPMDVDGPRQATRGELAGADAAEVRAALRRIGLQVIDLRPVRRGRVRGRAGSGSGVLSAVIAAHCRWQSARRRPQRAELYDALATMLRSGMPLLQSVDTIIASREAGRRSSRHLMLTQIREDLRDGQSLASACAQHPGWFEPVEIAMIAAAQHGGTLPEVLADLADRHEAGDELTQKLIGALAYPSVVALVGIAVVMFLSVRTLPDLTGVLSEFDLPIPALTARVMATGRFLFVHGWWLVGTGVLGAAGFVVLRAMARRREGAGWTRMWTWMRPPRVLRRMAVAHLTRQLAELLRTGVPMVDALRVLAPTCSSARLSAHLQSAAAAVERGDDLGAALSDPIWFDTEFCRLVEIGQASGELDRLLDRLAHRYARQSSRLIQRLTTMLEPAVILTLAFFVGLVVLAAVLPMVRLQEILR